MSYIAFGPKTRPNIKTDIKSLDTDRGFIAHLQVSATNATAASTTNVLAATALTAAAQAIITNITNPSVPRNVRIVGNAAGITGNVVVKGTNYNNDTITETIALNGTTAVEGNKAFKAVIEIDLPIQTHAGTDTVSVGTGEKIGLPYKLVNNTVLFAFLSNTKEATAPTVTVDSVNVEGNTVDLSTALSSKAVDIYLIV